MSPDGPPRIGAGTGEGPVLNVFQAPFAQPEEAIAAEFLRAEQGSSEAEARIDARATRLVKAIRERSTALGGIEEFLHAYSLSTKEGLALMVLAESLLRVPDDVTADRLIEDKLTAADFAHHPPRSDALLVTASAWALGISARIASASERPETVIAQLAKRIGVPAMRLATRQAMRILGSHFVLGQTIEEALARARERGEFLYSFDMLGEGARTAADAEQYFHAYDSAIEAIGRSSGAVALPARPGISVKLSALHPRYEAISRERVLKELAPRLLELARRAQHYDLNFTVDAEEADRLELSLDVVGRVIADPSLARWSGFGLAVQAYQKRAGAVIDWLEEAARALGRHFTIRLVKGAYWDTEIKRAQERGLADYPVFTRKSMTDLSYAACVRKLLAARPRLYPQFATHNALTVATVIEAAEGIEGYEFQRLHGMGEALYEALLAEMPGAICRVYAPVGMHRDLLAYLVRRLLENGANSSFVSAAADPSVPISEILRRPRDILDEAGQARHRGIAQPKDIFQPRRNSTGFEFGDRDSLDRLVAKVRAARPPATAQPVIDGAAHSGRRRIVRSPIDGAEIGEVVEAETATAAIAMQAAQKGFAVWNATPLTQRAAIVEHAADLIEKERASLIALLQREGGKTLDDAISEVREAADFCRYYAADARAALKPEILPGPTGEANELRYRGRGVFVAISPWNFPLSIFTGQIAAALVAGNSVVAKPAEQTPLIAACAVELLHAAGIPASALHLVPGAGDIGAALIADQRVAGVVFTGSLEVAQSINRTLAKKDGAIVPLIAETGGVNTMIVDASALPEQVTDDVTTSAFRSAGQRCSALRLLCVQSDVADQLICMIAGAGDELTLGDPREIATHVGPVIDADAKQRLDGWITRMAGEQRVIFRWDTHHAMPSAGTYVPPTMIALDRTSDLREEVFGPILHVVRYEADKLDVLLDDIAAAGFGLTLGVHSRIDDMVERVIARLPIGNVYVNRSMIGAVVGSQPFGGSGLSGTGPKAGGPNYVRRFAQEQTVTINTAAVGGNASLLSEGE